MDVCFVPSLEHLCCVKITTSLLNDIDDLRWKTEEEYDGIKSKITENISRLTLSHLLQKKLEKFIPPLLCEVENWVEFCHLSLIGYCNETPAAPTAVLSKLRDAIPLHWLPDGTIDREIPASIVVKNGELNPVNRFILSCHFCMYEDVLDLWSVLFKIERAYLRHAEIIRNPHISDFIIKWWTEFLETSPNTDWESFVAWALERRLWKSNVFILKRVLATISPDERRQFLVKALTGEEVSSDVIRFGLSLMSGEEQEVVFRKSPFEVFKCILTWPLRSESLFFDVVDRLWPYINVYNFCRILYMILNMIRKKERNYVELLVIAKSFWAQSPEHYKKLAEKNVFIYKPLRFILDYDFAQQFHRGRFLKQFNPSQDYRIPLELYHYHFMENFAVTDEEINLESIMRDFKPFG